jgi:hypothetical protein
MQPTRRHLLLAGCAAALARPAVAAPASRLIDERWTRHGEGGDPDSGPWGAILARHLRTGTASGVNLFDYEAATADRPMLRAWLEEMAAVAPTTLSRYAAMAYWINLYNALTVDLVLEAWPVGSIREVRGGLFDTGPWDESVIRVEGRDLSLDDIEHGILRPVWRDPRIHYGVNCASIGCPDLAPEPYAAARLDAMLDAGAAAYVAHPRGCEATGDGLVVSSIYQWFIEDFGDSEAGVIDHLATHAEPAKRARIRSAPGIADDRYDWSINAA